MLGVFRVPEVVAIGGFVKPSALAGQLARVPAGGFAAVTLTVQVAVIGEEKLAAAAALTPLGPYSHRESKPPRRGRELKRNRRREEEPRRKKEETTWREVAEENAAQENTISDRRR
jgi:hypothetical protein